MNELEQLRAKLAEAERRAERNWNALGLAQDKTNRLIEQGRDADRKRCECPKFAPPEKAPAATSASGAVAYAIEYKSARPPIGSEYCLLSQHIRFPSRAAAQAVADAITQHAGNPTRPVEMPTERVAWWRR